MIACARSEGPFLVDADPVMGPHRVMDVEAERLVSLVLARQYLDHRDRLAARTLPTLHVPCIPTSTARSVRSSSQSIGDRRRSGSAG